MIPQRRRDEIQLAKMAEVKERFARWKARLLGKRAEREEEPPQEEAVEIAEEPPEVENA